jgi:hypothetical protein
MELKRWAITSLGGGLLTRLMATTRYDVRGQPFWDEWWGAGRPAIYVLWHGRLLPGSFYHRRKGLATLISQHRDGDYIADVVEGWGFRAIRGSSSRGGSGALREIVRTLKGGTALAITPDGPRGPRQKMKSGPLVAAQLTGVPVIPVGIGSDQAWWVGGWDRFLIPKPFGRIRLEYGEPMFVPREATPAEVEGYTLALEERLNALTEIVDRPWS